MTSLAVFGGTPPRREKGDKIKFYHRGKFSFINNILYIYIYIRVHGEETCKIISTAAVQLCRTPSSASRRQVLYRSRNNM